MTADILIATKEDTPVLIQLINNAYRGEASRQGWTTEAEIIEGDQRISESSLEIAIQKPGAGMLKYINEQNEIEGCVYLNPHGNGLYLGMLSVWPWLQGKGIGKKLIKAAENYAIINGYHSIIMQVIHVRAELIAWYERLGYQKTGERQPFENGEFGTARIPLEFITLEKIIPG
jgi:ribosomal protein S18 acetylase RimI-like enzyme